MVDNGNGSSIKKHREDLFVAYQECEAESNRYSLICPVDETSAAWMNAIATELDFWINTVEEHLISRAYEISSSASPLRQFLVPLMTHFPHHQPTFVPAGPPTSVHAD